MDPRQYTENVGTTIGKFDRLLDEAHRKQGLIYAILAQTADPLEPPKARPCGRCAAGWAVASARSPGRLSRQKPSNG